MKIKKKTVTKKMGRTLVRSPKKIDDIKELAFVAEMITHHINQYEILMTERIEKLELRTRKLEQGLATI